MRTACRLEFGPLSCARVTCRTCSTWPIPLAEPPAGRLSNVLLACKGMGDLQEESIPTSSRSLLCSRSNSNACACSLGAASSLLGTLEHSDCRLLRPTRNLLAAAIPFSAIGDPGRSDVSCDVLACCWVSAEQAGRLFINSRRGHLVMPLRLQLPVRSVQASVSGRCKCLLACGCVVCQQMRLSTPMCKDVLLQLSLK